MIEAAGFSEMSGHIYQTIRRHMPENIYLQRRCPTSEFSELHIWKMERDRILFQLIRLERRAALEHMGS
jgi:hypothetical protein